MKGYLTAFQIKDQLLINNLIENKENLKKIIEMNQWEYIGFQNGN